jgi:hypothetical protein
MKKHKMPDFHTPLSLSMPAGGMCVSGHTATYVLQLLTTGVFPHNPPFLLLYNLQAFFFFLQ